MRKKPGPKPGDVRLIEAGRKGAEIVKAKIAAGELPADFYNQVGKKGGSATRARHGEDHYSEIGKKGGLAVRKDLGRDHFSEIGRKGGRAAGESRKRMKG